MKKTALAATLTLFASLAAAPAFAEDEYNVSTGLTAAGTPLGLHGVDPVAFLDIGNRIEGRAEHAAVHDGVTYYFATAANRAAFEASPARYLPQNGGFCTYGVSVGKKFDGDPQYAAVIDDRLYVFLSEEIFHAFLADRETTISRAADNWPRIRETPAEDL